MWKNTPFEKCLQKTKVPHKLPKKEYLESGKFPVVSQEATLISGYHNEQTHVFNVSKPVVIFGDHTQVLKYVDFDFVVGADGVKILLPIEGVDTKYFYYLLQVLMPKGKGYARHYRLLKELNIFYPPLAEQQRIVAKLDAAFAEIDGAIDAANAQINNIDMLRKRILNGWIEKNASPEDYCTVQDCIDKEWLKQPFDGNHGEIHPKASDYTATGVPFIMARDLSNGEVNLTECKFISNEQAASLRVGFAKNNDVLFTHKGTIGEVALLECQADFVMLTPQVTAYRVIDESRIDRLFLYYLFKSVFFQSQIQQIAGIGTTRAYIGITRQKQLSLCLPSIELQQQAVSVLKNSEPYVSTIGFANKNKLEQLLRLKSALLAQELQSEAV